MKMTDEFDIMIESLTKEWMDSMAKQIPNEKWETSQYSKAQITKAGSIISTSSSTASDMKAALEILNNWRSSHAYPLQIIASNLRRNTGNAIVVQRLKRLDSISGKLIRFPSMSLYRMQDLGGCRVIVESIDDVYATIAKYKSSRIRHVLKRENDYIQNPKESGYRSYHIVYQFHSDNKETYNRNMLIEIQFRTKLQHMWATAVEMMGIYTKTALKASIGDEGTLRFFSLVSSVFAKMENTPVVPNTADEYNNLISEIKSIDKEHNIVSRLSALSVAINYVNENSQLKNGYYILILNYSKKMLNIRRYKMSEVELATKVYNEIECSKSKEIDAVLVSATSFDTLKVAYSNYFTDIGGFVEMMRRILT